MHNIMTIVPRDVMAIVIHSTITYMTEQQM